MKIPYFLILTACASATNVYAGSPPRMPPVLDDSTYNDATPAAQPAPGYDDPNNLDRLKSDISELKSKVQEQEEAINSLERANAELLKKAGGHKSTAPVSKPHAAGTPPALDEVPAEKTAAKGVETEKEHYQHGSDLLKKGDYAQAIAEFKGFIAAHPKSKYADNAQYWIGVALLNKGDKKAAIQAFDHVARAYPKSEKVPDALFKLADTLLSTNNKAKAKEYFDYVIQNYPTSDAAKSAAKKKAAAKL